jgi:hypothetical protein
MPHGEFVLSTKVDRRLVPATGDVEGVEGFYGTPTLARLRDYSRDGALVRWRAAYGGWVPTASTSRSSTTRTTTRKKHLTAPTRPSINSPARERSGRSASA